MDQKKEVILYNKTSNEMFVFSFRTFKISSKMLRKQIKSFGYNIVYINGENRLYPISQKTYNILYKYVKNKNLIDIISTYLLNNCENERLHLSDKIYIITGNKSLKESIETKMVSNVSYYH